MMAWLFTVNEWTAVRTAPYARTYTSTSERQVALYASGFFNEALLKIKRYESLFMEHYTMTALTLTLLSFSKLPEEADPQALFDVGVTDLDKSIYRLRQEIAKKPSTA